MRRIVWNENKINFVLLFNASWWLGVLLSPALRNAALRDTEACELTHGFKCAPLTRGAVCGAAQVPLSRRSRAVWEGDGDVGGVHWPSDASGAFVVTSRTSSVLFCSCRALFSAFLEQVRSEPNSQITDTSCRRCLFWSVSKTDRYVFNDFLQILSIIFIFFNIAFLCKIGWKKSDWNLSLICESKSKHRFTLNTVWKDLSWNVLFLF